METFFGFKAPSQLPFLYRLLHCEAAQWGGIALCLGVQNIDHIKRNANRCVDYALALALQEWLESGKALWEKLVDAVKSPIGANNERFAKEIADTYQGKFFNIFT